MLKEEEYCECIEREKFNKDLAMTYDEEKEFNNVQKCHTCNKEYNEEDIRVRDHCHIAGKDRGSAYQDCNLNFKLTEKIQVMFQNLRGYDSHFIMQEIDRIANNNTYINKMGDEE